MSAFPQDFSRLVGYTPYPWQTDLWSRLCAGNIPEACVIPTGLGKTSVIAIWLLARLENPALPRRLVYVVNRRTVVDQTTEEVVKLRARLPEIGLSATDLAISTLRGQFADNRDWSADPSRQAVVCGTVDMIGSRLLFSGYGVGFKARPLHAGFLGQDALLVHDEAHLEEPFQRLVAQIEGIQRLFKGEATGQRLRLMALTATPRGAKEPLCITDADREAAKERLEARKTLSLVAVENDADVFANIAEHAHAFDEKNRAVLVFVRTLDGVKKVVSALIKKKVDPRRIDQLTGTIRGKERDTLLTRPVFGRFLPQPRFDVEGTVYLVCTSAGEVGVNISADDLVCDLSPFDSMAQRFGRVNRFGARRGDDGASVIVVHPTAFDTTKPLEVRREKTLGLLQRVQSVSPSALESLPQDEREVAFTPAPEWLPLTDILVDAWSLTSVRARMPGRPPVEPYLHGIADYQEPETWVAWREEVGAISRDMFEDHPPQDLLEVYDLRPHELLRDVSRRVFDELRTLGEKWGDRPVWLVDESGEVDARHTLGSLTAGDDRPIRNKTVLLPHDVGGLSPRGTLDGDVQATDDVDCAINNDVADGVVGVDGNLLRVRVSSRDDARAAGMRPIRTIVWPDREDDSSLRPRVWYWFERPVAKENSRHAVAAVELDVHVGDVVRQLDDILSRLSLDGVVISALRLAAKWHDLGKRRDRWQASIGRSTEHRATWFAKSGHRWSSRRETAYRHEFGSLLDVTRLDECADLRALDTTTQDLVLHLIASHHGMARPHFGFDQILDDDHPAEAAETIAPEVLRRFARLQLRYGHWGLAYIESILRAADWHASAFPSKFFDGTGL